MAWQDNITSGVVASRPAASAVINGAMYFATDEAKVYLSDGVSTWTEVLAGGGGSPWALVTANPYTTAGIWDFSVDGSTASPIAFTGLGAYNDIKVVVRNVTTSVSGRRHFRVGHGGGPTYLTASGDYERFDGTGTVTTTDTFVFGHATDSSAARSAYLEISGFDLTTPKLAHSGYASTRNNYIIPTTNALTAVQVVNNNGGNFTGGTIHVYGKLA